MGFCTGFVRGVCCVGCCSHGSGFEQGRLCVTGRLFTSTLFVIRLNFVFRLSLFYSVLCYGLVVGFVCYVFSVLLDYGDLFAC